jgi:hypothetical protein
MDTLSPRLTLRGLMIGVAFLAVSLAVMPLLPRFSQTFVWYGRPPPLGMGSVGNRTVLYEPRLRPLFIPALSVVVVLRKPARCVVWGAIGVDLIALLSWALLYRVCVGPGSVFVWPDDMPRLIGERSVSAWPGLAHLFGVSTNGELIDLTTLVGLLILLISLLTNPIPRWLRASLVLPTTCYMFISWLGVTCLERYWGPGDPPRIGLARIPRASEVEMIHVLGLFAILLWLLAVLLLSFRRAKEL